MSLHPGTQPLVHNRLPLTQVQPAPEEELEEPPEEDEEVTQI